eukprot:TRINITY_DN4299_c0_g1_i4.p1 TRINITY_DN4299_c0_g1~~TRINITY_DN4299_c0_g1_i4.p1  ORF type:complete len:535 (-),score=59.73 TRINITY_DN4299_c0_g1_i4:116-1720(-)
MVCLLVLALACHHVNSLRRDIDADAESSKTAAASDARVRLGWEGEEHLYIGKSAMEFFLDDIQDELEFNFLNASFNNPERIMFGDIVFLAGDFICGNGGLTVWETPSAIGKAFKRVSELSRYYSPNTSVQDILSGRMQEAMNNQGSMKDLAKDITKKLWSSTFGRLFRFSSMPSSMLEHSANSTRDASNTSWIWGRRRRSYVERLRTINCQKDNGNYDDALLRQVVISEALICQHRRWASVGSTSKTPSDARGSLMSRLAIFGIGILKCIQSNGNHFTGGGSREQYMAIHRAALDLARNESIVEALRMEAMGQHFLSDLFAAGHARVPFKNLTDVCGPVNCKIALNSITDYMDHKGFGGVSLVNVMHDEDNKAGLVMTFAGSTDTFICYGDESFFSDANRKCALQSIAASLKGIRQVWQAYKKLAHEESTCSWCPQLLESQPASPLFKDSGGRLFYRTYDDPFTSTPSYKEIVAPKSGHRDDCCEGIFENIQSYVEKQKKRMQLKGFQITRDSNVKEPIVNNVRVVPHLPLVTE